MGILRAVCCFVAAYLRQRLQKTDIQLGPAALHERDPAL